MASIGHVAIGLAARRWYERDQSPPWSPITSMVVWSAISLLPDADVYGFRLGILYAEPWGHRGATHSLVFAGLMGLIAWMAASAAKLPVLRSGLLVAAVVASHGILDTLTDGGLGCALFWPFSNERFFAPWTPLPVCPLGAKFHIHGGAACRDHRTRTLLGSLPLRPLAQAKTRCRHIT
jgi:inner membrane protein